MEKVNCYLCGSTNAQYLYQSYASDMYVKCKVCGLVYQNPRVKTEYDGTYWESPVDPDGVTRHLLMEREKAIRNRFSGDIKHIHKLRPGRILDVGCGLGFFLSAISNSWDKYGMDVSKFTVNYVQEHYPEVKVARGELWQIAYPDNFFDVVDCFAVMEHVGTPHRIIKEISRTVKPDGLVILGGTPNIESFVAKRFKGNFRLLGTPHIVLWSRKTLTYLLRAHNLEPFKVRYPFFGTEYFTLKNLLRLWDTSKVSPPFYGNDITIYARKI